MVTFTAEAMIFAKVVVPIVVWILENILALGAAVIGCIFIFVVILGIGKLLLDGLASAGSGGEGSGQSASSFEAGGSSGYSESRSEKRSEPKRDNRTPREKDKNPNHHYIANYQETGGIKLYKVHNSMGNYVELDNSVVSRKVCSLADAEKGKHRFYRENSGQEIRLDDIPWQKNEMKGIKSEKNKNSDNVNRYHVSDTCMLGKNVDPGMKMNTITEIESEAAILTQENEPESEVRQKTTPDVSPTIMKEENETVTESEFEEQEPTTTPEPTAMPEPVTMYITRLAEF